MVLQKFFCFRLHTAAVIIGWVGAIASLFNIAFYSVAITKIDTIIDALENSTATNNSSIIPDSNDPVARSIILTCIVIYLIFSIINCAASSLVVAGAIKEKHLMFIPWLANGAFSLAYSTINFIGLAIFMLANSSNFGVFFGVIFMTGIALSFQFYVWLAIYSLFKNLRMCSEQQRLIPKNAGTASPSYTRI